MASGSRQVRRWRSCIGSGAALGREGPTVQMGAALGTFWARLLLRNAPDQSVINAAGAGAGLAVAFNAPIGASVFVIEELTRSVTPRLLVATLVTSAIAVAEMRALLGNAPDFLVARGAATPVALLPYYLVAGALLGLLGAAYNATIVGFLDLFQWLQRLPAVVPAAMVGLVVGLLAWFAPSLVGGGDFLAQTIIWNRLGLSSLAMVLVVRFFSARCHTRRACRVAFLRPCCLSERPQARCWQGPSMRFGRLCCP